MTDSQRIWLSKVCQILECYGLYEFSIPENTLNPIVESWSDPPWGETVITVEEAKIVLNQIEYIFDFSIMLEYEYSRYKIQCLDIQRFEPPDPRNEEILKKWLDPLIDELKDNFILWSQGMLN